MKIAQIVPGVGNTSTCTNCLRDAALIKKFRKLGHEVVVIPLYLPFRPDGERLAGEVPIFFGGINVYLLQKSVLFRKTPGWFDRMFDNEKLLEWVSGKFQMTDTRALGQTTVSMLKGRDGFQVKEVDRLSGWLGEKGKEPDVVYLSNVLLAGLAKPLKEALGGPVVCLLEGEEKFLDELGRPYSEQAWSVLGECVSGIDAFIAIDEGYGEVMKERLGIGQDKMHIVDAEGAGDDFERGAGGIASVFTGILENFSEGEHA